MNNTFAIVPTSLIESSIFNDSTKVVLFHLLSKKNIENWTFSVSSIQQHTKQNRRTVERIVKKLSEQQILIIIGTQKFGQYRPTILYSLSEEKLNALLNDKNAHKVLNDKNAHKVLNDNLNDNLNDKNAIYNKDSTIEDSTIKSNKNKISTIKITGGNRGELDSSNKKTTQTESLEEQIERLKSNSKKAVSLTSSFSSVNIQPQKGTGADDSAIINTGTLQTPQAAGVSVPEHNLVNQKVSSFKLSEKDELQLPKARQNVSNVKQSVPSKKSVPHKQYVPSKLDLFRFYTMQLQTCYGDNTFTEFDEQDEKAQNWVKKQVELNQEEVENDFLNEYYRVKRICS